MKDNRFGGSCGRGRVRHRRCGRRKGMVVLLCLTAAVLLAGCGKDGRPEDGESARPVVNFRAITLGNMPEGGMDEIYRQLDALTIPELNCTLRFEFIPWGNERRQLNIATASGEYDFIPGGVFSDYRTLVYKNVFLDMNEYLDAVPALAEHYATFDADTLKKCEINGGLYGLPQLGRGGIQNIGEGFLYREDLRREWGLEGIRDLETLEAYLYRARQDERYQDSPMVTDNRVWSSLWMMLTKGKYLEVNSFLETPFLVVDASDPYRVLNRMETPEFREVLDYIRKWSRDGILDPDMLSRSDNEGELGKSLLLADRKPCETNNPIWSVDSYWIPKLQEDRPEWEFGFYPYNFGNEKFYIGSLAGSSVISISAKTTEPELAMKLLEKIHTDIRYYSLVAYGTEGDNYELVDGKIDFDNINAGNRFAWTAVSDEVLNYEAFPVNEKWAQVYDAIMDGYAEIAERAEDNPIDGFTFSVPERQQRAVEQVWLQYFQPLICGYGESSPEELEAANGRLYAQRNMEPGAVICDMATNNWLVVPEWSEKTDAVMYFLNWMFGSREAHDLFDLGIEGEDWEAIGDDGYKKLDIDENLAYSMPTYSFTQNPTYIRVSQFVSENPEIKSRFDYMYNPSTYSLSPLSGFVFDTSRVETQIANISALSNELQLTISMYDADEAAQKIEQWHKDAADVGLEEVRAELISQIQAFLDAKSAN